MNVNKSLERYRKLRKIIKMNYRERIERILTKMPMSGKQLAEQLEVPVSTIYCIMRAEKPRPNFNVRFKLEAWLQKKEKEIE